MGTISNHKSCYNNTVHHNTIYDIPCEQSVTTRYAITTLHHYRTYDIPWEQSVTTRYVITTLHHYNIRHAMGTICIHRSCYNNTVHHYTTYDKTWEQSVTTGAVITTLYITTQHTTKHGNNQ